MDRPMSNQAGTASRQQANVERAVADHITMLEERVFQVRTRWPHFRLLLADLQKLAQTMPASATVVSLERTLLYGGISLLAPIFHRQNFVSVDCSPHLAEERGAYNAAMVDDPRTVRIPFSKRGSEVVTGLDDDTVLEAWLRSCHRPRR